MLNRQFLDDLRAEFPAFYDRVHAEAMREASRLRAEAGGDVDRALMRARFEGALHLWWPYVKGTIPVFGDDRPAMESFTRLVLTVDHVVGYQPPDMEAARKQVLHVLENTADADRLVEMLRKAEPDEKAAGAAGAAGTAGAAGAAGALATTTALFTQMATLRRLRKGLRFVPAPVRMAIGTLIVATLLSVPLMAGYSASTQAERAARNFGEMPRKDGSSETLGVTR